MRRAMGAHLQPFTTTIFNEMSVLAARTGSINLGQGFPDTDGPAEVAEAAVAALEPYYDSYAATIAMAGARRRVVTLRAPDFALDPAALAAAVGPQTRLILLNSPHNPTGRVLSAGELEAVARVCVERDLLAVTDEVYEHLRSEERRVGKEVRQ